MLFLEAFFSVFSKKSAFLTSVKQLNETNGIRQQLYTVVEEDAKNGDFG